MEFVLTFHQPAGVYATNADPVRGAAVTAARAAADAAQAYRRAGALTGDPAVREWLVRRLEALG